jgi:hypothetical protein
VLDPGIALTPSIATGEPSFATALLYQIPLPEFGLPVLARYAGPDAPQATRFTKTTSVEKDSEAAQRAFSAYLQTPGQSSDGYENRFKRVVLQSRRVR